MHDVRPEWYDRLKEGPFQEPVFTSELKRKVEEKARIGGAKPFNKRSRPWSAAGLITLVIVCAIAIYPFLRDQLLSTEPASNKFTGDPTVMHGQFKKLLKVGMNEEEVVRALGKMTEGQAFIRDFAQPHVEDPNDMSTWTELKIWRYDYGVREGYNVKSDLNEANGFDFAGMSNGDIQAQLVIVWKEGRVDRALFRYMKSGAVYSSQIGPSTEDAQTPQGQDS